MFEAVIVTGASLEGDLTKQVQRCAGGPRAKGIRVLGNGDVLIHTHETAGTDWNLFICSGVYLELLSSKKITEDVEEEIVGLDHHYHSHAARVRAKFDLLVGAEVPSQ